MLPGSEETSNGWIFPLMSAFALNLVSFSKSFNTEVKSHMNDTLAAFLLMATMILMMFTFMLTININNVELTTKLGVGSLSKYGFVLFVFSIINYIVHELMLGKVDQYGINWETSEDKQIKLGFKAYFSALKSISGPVIFSLALTLILYVVLPYDNSIVNHATIFATVSAIAIVIKEKAINYNKLNK